MSGFPPSLQISPARIREYLRTHEVPCSKCGYPLLGLPEPRCPECGTWTDVTGKLRIHNLRFIKSRLGSLGTADEFLIRRWSGEIRWLCRFDDVKELKVVNRWSARARCWLILLTLLCIAEAFAFLVLLGASQQQQAAIGLAMFVVLGMILGILAVGLDPQRWVVVETTGRSYKIPLHTMDESEANAAVERLSKVIEEGRGRPPTPDLDPQHEGVKEGCCHRCGYEMNGPRLMVNVPIKEAQVMGGLLIAFSFLFLFCCGSWVLEVSYGSPELIPCSVIIGVFAAAWIIGLLLIRSRHEVPSVPDWKGSGQCPACGWKRNG